MLGFVFFLSLKFYLIAITVMFSLYCNFGLLKTKFLELHDLCICNLIILSKINNARSE